MTTYDALFEHVLRRIDAERAHHLGFAGIRAAGLATRWYPGAAVRPVNALGLTFPSALGLAAGFDKNAVGIDALAALGFGHVEVGTVTGEAQPGNPKPQLFRLPTDRTIINQIDFNNDGAETVAARLASRARGRHSPVILGVNIGKTKLVPEDDQAAVLADYTKSARLLSPFADYLVVNVSSPNTPGLRSLQAVDRLGPLLEGVRHVADVPLLVKIAPDLADEDVLAVARLALELRLDGIIATNTTVSRAGLRSAGADVEAAGAGGLSGTPVAARSLEVLRLLHDTVGGDLTLVSVGGISTPEQARERLHAGATLVQAYTGFVYGGPWWPRRITQAIAHPTGVPA
ncbi:MAG: quinone-dependent dihydroorotate dehydrogenase [Nocardioides sp.]